LQRLRMILRSANRIHPELSECDRDANGKYSGAYALPVQLER
jgi:hypothetical protein